MYKKTNLHGELVKKKLNLFYFFLNYFILFFFFCIKSTRVGPILLALNRTHNTPTVHLDIIGVS